MIDRALESATAIAGLAVGLFVLAVSTVLGRARIAGHVRSGCDGEGLCVEAGTRLRERRRADRRSTSSVRAGVAVGALGLGRHSVLTMPNASTDEAV